MLIDRPSQRGYVLSPLVGTSPPPGRGWSSSGPQKGDGRSWPSSGRRSRHQLGWPISRSASPSPDAGDSRRSQARRGPRSGRLLLGEAQAPSAAPQAAFGAAGSTRASVSGTWWRLFAVSCVRFRRLAGRVRPSGDGPGAVSAVRTLSSSRPSADRTREPRRVLLRDSRCDRSHGFVVCDLTPVRGFRGENEVVETRSLESEANHTGVGLWLGAMPL